MPWVKLDDGFTDHPKVVKAGPLAIAMQVAALGYCNRELTDGFIPRAVARRLIDCDPDMGISVGPADVIARLVDAGLWSEVEGGYQVHDFLDYQPSREEVLAIREKRADAGRRGGLQRAQNLKANEANAKQVAKQTASKTEANELAKLKPVPVPVPVPDPQPDQEHGGAHAPSAPAARAPVKYSAAFEIFWSAWSEPPSKGHGGKQEAYAEWKRLALDRVGPEEREAVLRGLRAWQACDRWRRGYVKDAHRWLKARHWEDEAPNDQPARASPTPNGTRPGSRGEDPKRWFAAGEKYATAQGESP